MASTDDDSPRSAFGSPPAAGRSPRSARRSRPGSAAPHRGPTVAGGTPTTDPLHARALSRPASAAPTTDPLTARSLARSSSRPGSAAKLRPASAAASGSDNDDDGCARHPNPNPSGGRPRRQRQRQRRGVERQRHCRWCEAEARDHVLEDPFAQGREAPPAEFWQTPDDDEMDVDEACVQLFGFRLNDSLASPAGREEVENALLDTPTVAARGGRPRALVLSRPLSSTALRRGSPGSTGSLRRPRTAQARVLVKIPRKRRDDSSVLQGPPSAFGEDDDDDKPRPQTKTKQASPSAMGTPAARRRWRAQRQTDPLNRPRKPPLVTNTLGRAVRTLGEQRKTEEKAWAAPTWESDTVFPEWLKARPDFVEAFPRFSKTGLNMHQILLAALRKPGSARSDTDTQHLANWIKTHSAFAGVSNNQCAALCRRVELETLSDGHVVFSQGDEGRHVFMIFEGSVDVLVNGTRVANLAAGVCFGELALQKPGARRAATVIAREGCMLASVRASDYRDVMNRASSQLLAATIRFLSNNVPIFADLSKQRLRRLASFLSKKSYDAGSAIIRQGQPGGDLLFLLSGSACVQKDVEVTHENRWPDGSHRWRTVRTKSLQPVVLQHFSPGSFFGEEQLLGSIVREYTVLASSDVEVLVLEAKDLEEGLQGVREQIAKANARLYKSVEDVRLSDRAVDAAHRRAGQLVREAYGDAYWRRKHEMREQEMRYALSPYAKYRTNMLGHDLEEVQQRQLQQQLENSPAPSGASGPSVDRTALNKFSSSKNMVAATVRRAAVAKAAAAAKLAAGSASFAARTLAASRAASREGSGSDEPAET